MLSRVADSLYWMSRYLERAEHTTRLLDVNLNLMLDESATSAERRWQRVLQALGKPKDIEVDGRSVCADADADLRHAEQGVDRCRASLQRGRTARHVREQISTEQWQRLN